MRESVEASSKASKKPRVPKVSELLPEAKIIKPSLTPGVDAKPSNHAVTTEKAKSKKVQPVDSKKLLQSSPKKVPATKSNKLILQTPSMSNIHKPNMETEPNHSPHSAIKNSKSPE